MAREVRAQASALEGLDPGSVPGAKSAHGLVPVGRLAPGALAHLGRLVVTSDGPAPEGGHHDPAFGVTPAISPQERDSSL